MSALVFKEVSKRFSRNGPYALQEVSFTIPRGSLCAFVGPNGAGKTTTFSIVSGFLMPESGEVNILSTGSFHPGVLKGRLGVVPQDAELPAQHTPMELLTHLGRLQQLGRGAKAEARRVLELVGLKERLNHRIHTLSHGMRRRVAVATALCGTPELIMMDEPMAGLDPVQAANLRAVLSSLCPKSTVLVSSHNLQELERLCDHVVMLQAGRVLRQGAMSEITGIGDVLGWQFNGDEVLGVLRAALTDHQFIQKEQWIEHRLPRGADVNEATNQVLKVLLEKGVTLHGLRKGRALEETFLQDSAGSKHS